MTTKTELIDYLGGTHQACAKKLGYTGFRGDNNIIRLPELLTEGQLKVIIMRMKARRIKVPAAWIVK